MAQENSVAFVEQDRTIGIADSQPWAPSWALDRIDQRNLPLSWSYSGTSTSSSVHAYVIDSGIRTTHVDFGGRATNRWDFSTADPAADNDCNGHGSHVAATLGGARYGVSKRVRLVGVRVMNCDGHGRISDIMAGVDWLTEHAEKPAVANMSIGGVHSDALDAAVTASAASGVTYVVAAGNEHADACLSSPADVPVAITVGATDARDARAGFSNEGACLDLFAPGVAVVSAYNSNDTSTATLSGTSMAAPLVAGAAAMVLSEHPTFTAQQVGNYLTAKSTRGKVTDRGTGSPDKLLYVSAGPPVTSARPIVSSPTLAEGVVGDRYIDLLQTTDMLDGTWAVTRGSLPHGLTMSDGLVTGTPTGPGRATFTAQYTDSVWYTSSRAITLTIKPKPTVTPVARPVVTLTALPITGPAAMVSMDAGLVLLAAGVGLLRITQRRRPYHPPRRVSAFARPARRYRTSSPRSSCGAT
jgi:subtilisin family serine protease